MLRVYEIHIRVTRIHVRVYGIHIGVGGREPVHGMRISCVRGGGRPGRSVLSHADVRRCDSTFSPAAPFTRGSAPRGTSGAAGQLLHTFDEKSYFAPKRAPGRPGLPPNHQKTLCVGYVSALGPPGGATVTKSALLRILSIFGSPGTLFGKKVTIGSKSVPGHQKMHFRDTRRECCSSTRFLDGSGGPGTQKYDFGCKSPLFAQKCHLGRKSASSGPRSPLVTKSALFGPI